MIKELAIAIPYARWTEALFDGMYDSVSNSEKIFEFAKENGIEALDYSLDRLLPTSLIEKGDKGKNFVKSTEELLEYFSPVKAAIEKTGMKLVQAHAPFPSFKGVDEEYNEYLKEVIEKCLAICNYLGIGALVVHSYSGIDKSVEREKNLVFYRSLIPAAKKYGVKICLENLNLTVARHVIGGTCSDADDAIEYIDTLNTEAGEDLFGFCFDLGHANISSINIRDFLRRIGSRLTLVHLHDNDGISDMHRLPMTVFRTDWEGLINGLRDIKYRGPLDFEIGTVFYACKKELIPANMRYTAEVGKYLRERLLADE